MQFFCLTNSYRAQLALEKTTSMGVEVTRPCDKGNVACFYLSCSESHTT